jgi:hypothetical protein
VETSASFEARYAPLSYPTRALQRIVEPFAFSVALYGAVLVNGTGHDLDVFLVPKGQMRVWQHALKRYALD